MVSRFPESSSSSDLRGGFRSSVDNFIRALRAAGARVIISATFRPPERAYLMHWSWLIVHGAVKAKNIQAMDGVDIEWVHPTDQATLQAAQAMVIAYGMERLNVVPALNSRHTEGNAIDMDISWSATLTIAGCDRNNVVINTLPRTGMNTQLQAVGQGYGVTKFWLEERDKPHLSSNGC